MDFCSGGGHLAILLAYLLPQAKVVLVENKAESLRRAMERIQLLGNVIGNIYIYIYIYIYTGCVGIRAQLAIFSIAPWKYMQLL